MDHTIYMLKGLFKCHPDHLLNIILNVFIILKGPVMENERGVLKAILKGLTKSDLKRAFIMLS